MNPIKLRGTRCSVSSCNNYRVRTKKSPSKNKIKYHQFPKTPERLQKWKQACKISPNKKTDNCTVCSVHFTKSDFKRDYSVSEDASYINAMNNGVSFIFIFSLPSII